MSVFISFIFLHFISQVFFHLFLFVERPKEWLEDKEEKKGVNYNFFSANNQDSEEEDKEMFVNTNRLVYEEEESSSDD